MVLSKRERYIVLATGLVVAALAADRFLLSPLLSRQSALQTRKAAQVRELERAEALFKRQRVASTRWKEMEAGGLRRSAGDTENALLHAVRDWSQDARLSLTTVRPERTAQKGRALEVVVQVSGTGSLRAVSRFLWRAESSALPVRVVEAQLGSRREGTDDLTVMVRLSALYIPESAKASPAGGAASDAKGVRP